MVVGGVFWALFCHTNTMLIEFKVYKTSKFFLQYSCNIHVDTIETTMSSFFRFFFSFSFKSFMFSLAVKGLAPSQVEDFFFLPFLMSPGWCIPAKVTDFHPFCLFHLRELRRYTFRWNPRLEDDAVTVQSQPTPNILAMCYITFH